MTGAAGFFPWNIHGLSAFSASDNRSTENDDKPSEASIDRDAPDPFEMMRQHDHWFGGKAAGESEGEAKSATTGVEPETVAYRVPAMTRQANIPEMARKLDQTDAPAQRLSIAETLADAERVLQTLPEMPQHSRLRASLTALEAALANTSLSELEAALVDEAKNARITRKVTGSHSA